MMNNKNEIAIPGEIIKSKIYLIRGVKVMLDSDLAELYGVTTGNMNKAVKRNISRFPQDFMFQLLVEEFENLLFQIGRSSWGGRRSAPYVFTEQGVAMLSSVLNSERAISVNIQIIRIFTEMREILSSHHEILLKLEQIEKKDIEQDEKITLIFEYLKQMEQEKEEERDYQDRPRIGYRQGGDGREY